LFGGVGFEHRVRVRMLYRLVGNVRVILEQLEERLLLESVTARHQQHADLLGQSFERRGGKGQRREEQAQQAGERDEDARCFHLLLIAGRGLLTKAKTSPEAAL